jgi:hypothetical protein
MIGAMSHIVGKTISGVIVKEGDETPRSQVFLLFTDGTYYELYSDSRIQAPKASTKADPTRSGATLPGTESSLRPSMTSRVGGMNANNSETQVSAPRTGAFRDYGFYR